MPPPDDSAPLDPGEEPGDDVDRRTKLALIALAALAAGLGIALGVILAQPPTNEVTTTEFATKTTTSTAVPTTTVITTTQPTTTTSTETTETETETVTTTQTGETVTETSTVTAP